MAMTEAGVNKLQALGYTGDKALQSATALLQSAQCSVEDFLAWSKIREAESAAAQGRGNLYCKVSEKGGMSIYGLQRMPVTLYGEQWMRLFGFADEAKKFLQENSGKLKTKAQSIAAKSAAAEKAAA